jgi:hypothetical protein
MEVQMKSDEKDRKPTKEQSDKIPGGLDAEAEDGVRQAARNPEKIDERHEDAEPEESQ